MFYRLIQQVIISFILIFLIHQIYNFIKNRFSTPTVIDLVNQPEKEYKEIYNIINTKEKNEKKNVEENVEENVEKNVEKNVEENVEENVEKNVEKNIYDKGDCNNINILPNTNLGKTDNTDSITLKMSTDEKNNMYEEMQTELQTYFNSNSKNKEQ